MTTKNDSVPSGYREIDDPDFVVLGGERDEGDPVTEVEGKLLVKEIVSMRGTPVGRYTLEREDGTPVTVLGAKLLDTKMQEVEVGDDVLIKLKEGTRKTGEGNRMKLFQVLVKE